MTQQDPGKQIAGQGVKRNPAEDDISSKTLRNLVPFTIKHLLKPPRTVPISVFTGWPGQ